jgi:tripartite-type tricarboxylate transporter receptor subunit TctC
VPTVIESGVPGFDVTAWHGVVAPARTPREIIAKLNKDIVGTLAMPDVQEELLVEGGEITPTTPEQFGAMIRAEFPKWTRVVKQAGITTD